MRDRGGVRTAIWGVQYEAGAMSRQEYGAAQCETGAVSGQEYGAAQCETGAVSGQEHGAAQCETGAVSRQEYGGGRSARQGRCHDRNMGGGAVRDRGGVRTGIWSMAGETGSDLLPGPH